MNSNPDLQDRDRSNGCQGDWRCWDGGTPGTSSRRMWWWSCGYTGYGSCFCWRTKETIAVGGVQGSYMGLYEGLRVYIVILVLFGERSRHKLVGCRGAMFDEI